MTKGESFAGNAECRHGHRSAMSNSAWCDLNKNCTVLKLPDMFLNPKFNCQKQINFIPKQYMLEGNGFEITSKKKSFKETEKTWNRFLKPAVNVAAPFIGMAVGAKRKDGKVAAARTNILKSISGGKILSFTDMHGSGLRLKVM